MFSITGVVLGQRPTNLILEKGILSFSRRIHRSRPTISDLSSLGARRLHRTADRPRNESCSTAYRSRYCKSRVQTQRPLISSNVRHRGADISAACLSRRDLQIRTFHSTEVIRHGGITRPEPGTGIKVHFKDSNQNLIKTVEANEGDDILAIAHEYDIDLEGACEGSVACSTCHVILPQEYYDLLPEPEDDENDMLDLAFGLTATSRLGCQVKLTKELDGITCTLPAATRNMFVDGHKPTHH